MAKFKTGDKVVLEISGVEMIGAMEANYLTTCGIRIKVAELEKAEALKSEAKKATTKKAAKKE